MKLPTVFSFPRYLAAKKTIDDRALHPHVWKTLAEQLAPGGQDIHALEVGAGIGTMVERVLEWGLIQGGVYTAIDSQAENIAVARQRLPAWAQAHDCQVLKEGNHFELDLVGKTLSIDLESIDLFDFMARETGRQTWDLVLAHAFLDLMDIPTMLPQLFRLLRPGGFFYFTLNFDGVTAFEPRVDSELDDLIPTLYHQTMDTRLTGGRPSGDSRSGRHLFSHLFQAGAEILAAGASDWIVYPSANGYSGDEAYFLHHILHFIETSLTGSPQLDPDQFQNWLAHRHRQVEENQLVYIAHQIDFTGRLGG